MSKVRIGVVGVGAIAQWVHLPGIKRCENAVLTAICDIDKEKLKAAAAQYGIDEAHCFTDYRDLIASPDVDAIDIPTPNDVHFEVAKAAIEAGKPYSLEKPITLTLEEATALAVKTEEKNLPSMVCFSYRFKATARYARALIKNGDLGDIYHVQMQYFQSWGLESYHTPLLWRFQKKHTGSGALGDLGCHALDLVRFVTGKEYCKIIGQSGTFIGEREKLDGGGKGNVDVDDYCNYMAEMDGGTAASFQITRFGFGRGNYQRMEIYGSKGALVYMLDVEPDVDELEICFGDVHERTRVFTKVPIPREYQSDQMDSFIKIINGTSDGLAATIQDGLKNQQVLNAILNSAATGSWVSL